MTKGLKRKKLNWIEVKKYRFDDWEKIPMLADVNINIDDSDIKSTDHFQATFGFSPLIPFQLHIWLEAPTLNIPVHDVRFPEIPEMRSAREQWEGNCQ